MKKSDQLKQQRTVKVDANKALTEKAKQEKRELTPEEEKTFDDTHDEIEQLDKDIARALKIEKNDLDHASRNGNPPQGDKGDGDGDGDGGEGAEKRKITKAYSVTRHIMLAREGKPLDGVEKEINEMAIAESRAAGLKIDPDATVHIPMSVLRGTGQSVSEDGGNYGGVLVHDQAPRVQTQFHPKLFLEELGATRLTGLSGGDLPLPVFGKYTFQWLGETEEITDQKVAIAGPKLTPHRLGASVPISNRLLAQSSIDAQNMVMKLLRDAYERTIQLAAINGSGTANQPTGILNTVGVFSAAHADDAPLTRALMLALQAAIETADSTEQSLGFLMHPSTKFNAMGTSIDAGSGRYIIENNLLGGYKVVSTSLMPALAGNRPVIYGDWSQLFIGEWGSLSLVVNPWSKLKSGQVEVVANAYADVAIAQPTAFAVDKFILS